MAGENEQGTGAQAPFSLDAQTLSILARILGSKKGGIDLSNVLNDPFLSFVAGTYQGEPQMSEGEIYAREAPTLLSIQEMEPEGSWRKVAAGQIASGIPAYRVKEDLIAQYNDNPEVFGALTSKEALSFVDEIAAENQKAQNAISKQLEQKDYFQERGLPSAQARYSPEDVVRLMPEAFADIGNKIANPPAEIQAMLKRIQDAGKAPVMREDKPKTAKTEKAAVVREQTRRATTDPIAVAAVTNGIANRYGVTQEQVLRPDRNDPKQVQANKAYQDEIASSAQLVGDLTQSGSVDVPWRKMLGGLARAAVPGLEGLVTLKNIATYRPETQSEKMAKQETVPTPAETGKKMVVSKSATAARNKLLADVAGEVSRMRGGEEYNRQYAAALANTLAGRLAESGRTPLGDAIVRQALAARAFRK
jgi:hypothetical protein